MSDITETLGVAPLAMQAVWRGNDGILHRADEDDPIPSSPFRQIVFGTITLSTTTEVKTVINTPKGFTGNMWVIVQNRSACTGNVVFKARPAWPDITGGVQGTSITAGTATQITFATVSMTNAATRKAYDLAWEFQQSATTRDQCISPFGMEISATGTGTDDDIIDVALVLV